MPATGTHLGRVAGESHPRGRCGADRRIDARAPAHLAAAAQMRARFLSQAPDVVDVMKRMYSAKEPAGVES